jgi:hypothetical protein
MKLKEVSIFQHSKETKKKILQSRVILKKKSETTKFYGREGEREGERER